MQVDPLNGKMWAPEPVWTQWKSRNPLPYRETNTFSSRIVV